MTVPGENESEIIASLRAEIVQLRASEEKYRALFESIDEGFCVIDLIYNDADELLDWRYVETNQVFDQQTGLGFVIGQTALEVIPVVEPCWIELFDRVAKTGEAERIERHNAAVNRWYSCYASRIGGDGSRQIAVVFDDITDRKQAEIAQRALFSNISHEFRTPLTLLMGGIEAVLDDRTITLDHRSDLELAYRSSVQLLKLVNVLLDFSRIEAGQFRGVFYPIGLGSFTAELASVFRSTIEQAGIQFTIDCPTLPEAVYVDPEMWEKIVFNLLSNAFKFTSEGEIAVRLTWKGDRVELVVQDTGIGISETELPHLFDRFYQVKAVKGRSFEGSGIGLSLVQELVKLHGGTIVVDSTEGNGSCFRVTIPTGVAHLSIDQIAVTSPFIPTAMGANAFLEEALRWLPETSLDSRSQFSDIQRSGSNTQARDSNTQARDLDTQARDLDTQARDLDTQARGSNTQTRDSNTQARDLDTQARDLDTQAWGSDVQMRGLEVRSQSSEPKSLSSKTARILLVDDNLDMRNYLYRLLNQRWEVETAANGAIALDRIQQNPPDLILSDVMMPEVDGFQLLQTLRSDPQTESIPVILLSARAGEESTIEGLEAGADDYLIKPFSARELIARVESQLHMSQLRQERSTNRFKTEFLKTITHELQAPLATILAWARLLQTQSFEPARFIRALASIERNATIQAELVKNLLDISSILSGDLHLKPQLVEFVPLVQNTIAQFQDRAAAKQIQLLDFTAIGIHGTMSADGDRLRQVLSILLDNAIKFTPPGGQVKVQLEAIESQMQLTVSDTGIGIAPEFLPRVFDRFSQAEIPSRHSPGGVGIGLAIARPLVELHHGTIEVESDGEGRGATFIIRLPL
ncbi:response regulator receiver sensor signal transduction histidine kinase [Leptolyngbya sp. NIES-3755]|nr:response regulator receiver sensor signal transduction histidine kinase [Leptolyngbya sp. NIES-3755]